MNWLRALLFSALLLLAGPTVSAAHDDDEHPGVSPVAVSAVDHDSATVAGSVVADSGTVTWWFEYGSSLKDARATAKTTAKATKKWMPVTAELPALAAATTYYVRLVARHDDTTRAGAVKSFATAAAPAAPGDPVPPAPEPTPAPTPAATPVLGEQVVAAPATGTLRVRLPGADEFTALTGGAIPVGAVVDATAGSVTLQADTGAGTQDGTFGGSRFLLRQGRDGYVNLHLRGRALRGCDERTLSAAGRKKPQRSLWGRDKGGRFRTHGRDSVATVRGTRWTMTDRCDGTLTTVAAGAVDVRVRRTGKVVRVRAGGRHLARHVR